MESVKLEYNALNTTKVVFNNKSVEDLTINEMRDIKDLLKDALDEINRYIKC